MKCLIFPKDNQKDFEEIEDYIRKGLEVHYADYYKDLYEVAFEQEDSGKKATTAKGKKGSTTKATPNKKDGKSTTKTTTKTKTSNKK